MVIVVVLSKLPSLSLLMRAIFCCRDFSLAALKTSYSGKNMTLVILGNSEGCPVVQKHLRVSFHLHDKVDNELKYLFDAGIIEPVNDTSE